MMNFDQLDIASLKGITQDSRMVKPGYLFAALPGRNSDGRYYIEDVLRSGASAILAPRGTKLPDGAKVALITDDNPRRAFAHIAAKFYRRQPETTVAVSGTNGKTSTAEFIRQLWKSAGYKSVSLGTLGVRGGGGVVSRSGSMTTPDPVSLHAELADLAAAGFTHLAMEASSHGLDQYRLDGVNIKAAGFTNLSRDHMDYHPDMGAYFTAKARLFTEILQEDGTAILNADALEGQKLSSLIRSGGKPARLLSYGYQGADIRILTREATPHGQYLKLRVFEKDYDVVLPLVGEFQVMNVLCALGLALSQNPEKQDDFVAALEHLKAVPGRLQLVPGHPENAGIYVDYAHTPDALENVLSALRPHTDGRLVCVFGCGGSRDRGKRPIMGRIAADLADHVIVTDDNPRSEDAAQIRAEILKAAPGAEEIGGRAQAIECAIANLQAGDVLVIAGKGHEQGQIFEGRTEPFDDVKEAEKAIENINKERKT